MVYQTMSAFLDFPDGEQELWWHSVAPMFAELLQMAGYDVHAQYSILGTWKTVVIPFLGVYPINGRDRWLSILTRYGTPFELSLNCSQKLVRYTFEPINGNTGTAADPFNTHAIWDSLSKLMPIQTGIDLECLRHFKADLTVNNEDSAYLLKRDMVQAHIRTQNKLALDLTNDGFVLKVYIYPALKALATGRSIDDLMFESIRRLQGGCSEVTRPLDALESYLRSRGPESTASPRLLSCDLIQPLKSRVKIYVLERMVSLPALKDIWTMGGRRQDPSTLAGLRLMTELWDLIQLPTGLLSYPDGYLQLGNKPNEQLPLMANYTLRQGEDLPEPQVYFTTFGMNDQRVMDGLTTFFERQGWTDMAQSYKNSLRSC